MRVLIEKIRWAYTNKLAGCAGLRSFFLPYNELFVDTPKQEIRAPHLFYPRCRRMQILGGILNNSHVLFHIKNCQTDQYPLLIIQNGPMFG